MGTLLRLNANEDINEKNTTLGMCSLKLSQFPHVVYTWLTNKEIFPINWKSESNVFSLHGKWFM